MILIRAFATVALGFNLLGLLSLVGAAVAVVLDQPVVGGWLAGAAMLWLALAVLVNAMSPT